MEQTSGKSFKSKDTIRVKIGPKDGDQWRTNIFFTPDSRYSTPRGGCKHYAHFVPTPCSSGEGVGYTLSSPYGSGEGISINVHADFPGLVEAAIQQTLVEVEVVEGNDKTSLNLLAIIIPARSKSK